ncbi:hypothetical protein PR003_g13512 [Phytophthora rubi]|uniref:Secreted protein n=1 Tax=Phytophthora rubi TaxID=129364 RepID=A0A6A3LGI0_9STRA|nr:hypothetical protein PR002_g14083 [Phytophthora rubi]KAE9019664.1 hypothetical protein PR001_g13824 [Phytophthora rubi]KAE9334456.1 hypothetical protein PR003_g13512 [Phytophthora rubi]
MRICLLVCWWSGWGLRDHGLLAFVQQSERASTRTRGASSCSVLCPSLPAVREHGGRLVRGALACRGFWSRTSAD